MDEKIDHGYYCKRLFKWKMILLLYNKVIATEMQLLEKHIDNIINGTYATYLPIDEGNYNSIHDFRFTKVLRAMSHSIERLFC